MAMSRIDWDADDGRIAVWEHPDLLTRVAESGNVIYIPHEAVELRATDPRPRSNFHDFWLGHTSRLPGYGKYAFDRIRSECKVGKDNFGEWDRQRKWLLRTLRVFYGCEDCLGSLSITSIRRTPTLRQQEDPTMSITQSIARFHVVEPFSDVAKGRPLRIDDFRLSTKGLQMAMHEDAEKRHAQLVQVVVPRTMQANRCALIDDYDEFWYTVAQPGDDDVLRQGRIPALGDRGYHKDLGSLRTTIMLSLARISHSTHTLLVVEIHPESGDVLSLRSIRTRLAVGLLTISPVEHLAMCQALRKGTE